MSLEASEPSELLPPEAHAIRPASPANAIRDVLDALKEPAYLELLGKSVGVGWTVGILVRRIPALAVPIALVGGIYLGMEIAAYVADEEHKAQIGPFIDVKEVDGGQRDI